MRHINRPALPGPTECFLQANQHEVDAGEDVQATWDAARKRSAFRAVSDALQQMAGQTQRCMYCQDSRGTDVDHFWPKAGPNACVRRVFRWSNLLLVCTGCNRVKGTQFPLDRCGRPLLLDPTRDFPMEHLYFDPLTGCLAPAFDAEGQPSRRGSVTLEVLDTTLNHEAVTTGRQRTYRNLRRATQQKLDGAITRRDFLAAVEDNGDYGLAQWFFLGAGATQEPFSRLRESDPHLWAEAQAVARTAS